MSQENDPAATEQQQAGQQADTSAQASQNQPMGGSGKTYTADELNAHSLTTSQNVTAPKLTTSVDMPCFCLTTSQNVTAPKPTVSPAFRSPSLTTSQNVTAPKQRGCFLCDLRSLTTSQNVTAPKPHPRPSSASQGLTIS